MANLADPLADCAIGFASKLPGGSEKQRELLDTAKTVCESAVQLVMATKDAGGNPKVFYDLCFLFPSKKTGTMNLIGRNV